MNYIFYHANCMDGLCSGWIVRRWLKETGQHDEKIVSLPVHYNNPLPEFDYQPEDNVYIIDFSYSRDVLKELAVKCHLTVLDHHETAARQLDGLWEEVPGDFIFDMNKSGAGLAWTWFYNQTRLPYLVELIQDRDLWQFKYPDTKPFTAVLQNHPSRHDLDFWEKLYSPEDFAHNPSEYCSFLMQEMIAKGQVIVEQVDSQLDTFIKKNKYKIIKWNGHKVALFNTTVLFSEMGEVAYQKLDIDFSMSYFINSDGRIIFSLRSSKNGINVGKIAEQHGGGGHPGASGFSYDGVKGMIFLSDLYML